jgi:hypothetical protein
MTKNHPNKKILDKNNVKENTVNDDDKVLKNNDEPMHDDTNNYDADEPKNKNEYIIISDSVE